MTNYKLIKITGLISTVIMLVLLAVQFIGFKQTSLSPITAVQDLVDTSASTLNSLPYYLSSTVDDIDDDQDEEFNDEQMVLQLAIPL